MLFGVLGLLLATLLRQRSQLRSLAVQCLRTRTDHVARRVQPQDSADRRKELTVCRSRSSRVRLASAAAASSRNRRSNDCRQQRQRELSPRTRTSEGEAQQQSASRSHVELCGVGGPRSIELLFVGPLSLLCARAGQTVGQERAAGAQQSKRSAARRLLTDSGCSVGLDPGQLGLQLRRLLQRDLPLHLRNLHLYEPATH